MHDTYYLFINRHKIEYLSVIWYSFKIWWSCWKYSIIGMHLSNNLIKSLIIGHFSISYERSGIHWFCRKVNFYGLIFIFCWILLLWILVWLELILLLLLVLWIRLLSIWLSIWLLIWSLPIDTIWINDYGVHIRVHTADGTKHD